LYAQRAAKYLKLFSGIATNQAEADFILLVALQRVLDEKLKHLVEDARRAEDIAAEIKKTAEELAEVNQKINLLIGKAFEDKRLKFELCFDYKEKIKEKDYIAAKEIIEILKQRQGKVFYELLIKKANNDQAEKDFWLSRIGKSMAISYTLTQIVIMFFLGILVLAAFGTAPWLLGIVIPLMIIGPILTGVSNWWLFRGLTPKTLIALRNMLLINTDVSLTSVQKIKLCVMSVFCIICGFMASYAFYILLIEMTPVALALLNLTGLAVLAAGFPWLVPLIMIVFVLPIFIKGALAVAAYFFRSLYEPLVRDRIWADICEYFSVITEYDKTNIEHKLAQLRQEASEHYGIYYKDAALVNKIQEVVDESITGLILIKKLERLKNGKNIKWHARLTLFFTCFFIPGMLGGIVATQLLGHANLSQALSWAHDFAELLSWFICGIAGFTYINVIISGGAKCIVDLAYGVIKTEGEEKTLAEQAKFQIVRGVNSKMNLFEAGIAYVLKKADNIKDFAMEFSNVIKSGWDLGIGVYFTAAAGGASFLTNSIQGKPTTYEEDWEAAQLEYKSAENCLHQWRQKSPELVTAETQLKPLLTQWQLEQARGQPIQQLHQQATNSWFSSIISPFRLRGF
jgi:hypothetical protein